VNHLDRAASQTKGHRPHGTRTCPIKQFINAREHKTFVGNFLRDTRGKLILHNGRHLHIGCSEVNGGRRNYMLIV
jgi:hypothetical protein